MARFYAALKTLRDLAGAGGDAAGSGKNQVLDDFLQALRERFREAMDDDFNTARAIGHLFEAVRSINAVLAENRRAVSASAASRAEETIRELGAALGLFREEADSYLRLDREREAEKRGLSVGEIERLIEKRRAARERKDWRGADEIRKGLADQGVILQDSPLATTWTVS
jgi:cysteinyl-tRNA synthetase